MPSPDRPTEPRDYAAINAAWAVLLAGVVAGRRRKRPRSDRISPWEILPMGAATFALSKSIVRERIGTWVREPFVEGEEEGESRPRGEGLQHAMGELVTCTRCVGAWSALAIVGLRTTYPSAGRTVTSVLAVSAVNDWLQASFRLLAERANRAGEEAARPPAHGDSGTSRTTARGSLSSRRPL
jgi:hypothetical protein